MTTDTQKWFGGIWIIKSNMIKQYNLCLKNMNTSMEIQKKGGL